MIRRAVISERILLAASLVVLAVFSSPKREVHTQDEASTLPGITRLIRIDPVSRQRYVAPPALYLQSLEIPNIVNSANIVVNYNGNHWTQEAQDAFEFAAGIWEVMISSSIPIVVDADFGPLGNGILGGAGPEEFWRNFPNAPQSNTWYPVAVANKLANVDLSPSSADIHATFSSNYQNWYFGTDNNTPGNEINFVSVVLHEIGHGLGFLGSMRVDNGSGSPECTGVSGLACYGYLGSPMIYDLFTENGAGTGLLTFPNNSAALTNQLESNDIYFNSPGGNLANGGGPVPLYAPSTWRPGSSYSHLAQSYDGTPHALMTYSISTGETIYNPGSVTLCMFEEMGWTVSETCSLAPISGLSAENDGPTILGSTTHFTATVTGGSVDSYNWDFGDGETGTGSNVAHEYVSAGVYTAVVTATNAISEQSASTGVQVDSSITGLSASNSSPTTLGETTFLTATIMAGSNVSYTWNYGDGESGIGQASNHIYDSPGVYEATVAATNSVSEIEALTMVYVDSLITGLAVEDDSPTTLGSATNFVATVTSGSDVSYLWDFGDGQGGQGAGIAHIYDAIGTYTATVTATNSVSERSASTSVLVEPSIFGLSAENSSPTILGDTTFLTATITAGSNVSFTWDFGDGYSGNGRLANHNYEYPGLYMATVTATNSFDEESTNTTVWIDAVISGLAVESSSPTVLGEMTILTASITAGSNVSYTWDFGDGESGSGQNTGHNYDSPGVYTAVVTAANSVSQQSVATEIQVDAVIEGLFVESSSPTVLGEMTTLTATVSAGSNVSYTWDFDDGDSDAGAHVTHRYEAAGYYTAVVTATNSVSQESESTRVEIVEGNIRIYLPLYIVDNR